MLLVFLLGTSGSALGAYDCSSPEVHSGNFLLWETEASAERPLELADPTKEIGVWAYDEALGVPVYVRQNPWSAFDPHGLKKEKVGEVYTIVNHSTKESYVGEHHGKESAIERIKGSGHTKARSLLNKKGTQVFVRNVNAQEGWQKNGLKTSGKDLLNSAKNQMVKSAELAEFEARKEMFKGYNFLNDKNALMNKNRAAGVRKRFGVQRAGGVRGFEVQKKLFGRGFRFNRVKKPSGFSSKVAAGGIGGAAAAAFLLANGNSSADAAEEVFNEYRSAVEDLVQQGATGLGSDELIDIQGRLAESITGQSTGPIWAGTVNAINGATNQEMKK